MNFILNKNLRIIPTTTTKIFRSSFKLNNHYRNNQIETNNLSIKNNVKQSYLNALKITSDKIVDTLNETKWVKWSYMERQINGKSYMKIH